jgi:hypothetical protein
MYLKTLRNTKNKSFFVEVLETVAAHCGYDFPWSLSRSLPIYGGYKAYFLLVPALKKLIIVGGT